MNILLGILAYVLVLVLLVYPMMRKAAPQNEAEQLENDNEQLEYIRKH